MEQAGISTGSVMNYDLKNINCNLCGEHNTRLYAKVSYADCLNRRPELKSDNDPIIKDEELANYQFSIVKCKNCEMVYVDPRLASKDLAELYKEEYFSHYIDTTSEAHKRRQETFKAEIAELEYITEKLGLGRRILDVGCGWVVFLDSLNNSWEKHGTEINQIAVNHGREKFGINILKGSLREIDYPDEMFDVVKMRASIEHLPDPISELREVSRIMRAGALVAINTPNIDSICGRIYKEKFRMVCPVRHIYYFSTKTLSQMLRKVGFRICKVSYHYFDTPYASWLDTLRILYDVVSLRVARKRYTVSPPFYGNIMDVYAVKDKL